MMFSTSTLYTSWCLGRLVSFAEPWKGDMFLDKVFSFHPENWGRFPIWLLFCQMGWNHQQVVIEKKNIVLYWRGGFFQTYKKQKHESIYVGRFASHKKSLEVQDQAKNGLQDGPYKGFPTTNGQSLVFGLPGKCFRFGFFPGGGFYLLASPLEVATVHDSTGRLRAEAAEKNLGCTHPTWWPLVGSYGAPTTCKWGGYGPPINGRK